LGVGANGQVAVNKNPDCGAIGGKTGIIRQGKIAVNIIIPGIGG